MVSFEEKGLGLSREPSPAATVATPSALPRRDFEPEIGRSYEIRFPFKTGEYYPFPDEPGPAPKPTKVWQPGWDQEASQYGEHHWCEAWGAEIRTVVSIHKPGRYPERVFYVRQWRDPDGKVFGKKRLRILATRDFRSWARGDRYERAFRSMVCEQPGYEPGEFAAAIAKATGQ